VPADTQRVKESPERAGASSAKEKPERPKSLDAPILSQGTNQAKGAVATGNRLASRPAASNV